MLTANCLKKLGPNHNDFLQPNYDVSDVSIFSPMEDYDRDNYHSKRQIRRGPCGVSQQSPSTFFGDDFGDGFSGGKSKVKAKNTVHRDVRYTDASRAPPAATGSSRPRYKEDTALIISSAEDSDSADELNLCGSQLETQSRSQRTGSRTDRPLSSSLEQGSTSRKAHNTLQLPARCLRATGKQREDRVAKGVLSPPKKEKEGRSSRSQGRPLNSPVNRGLGRTISSSRMTLRSYPHTSRTATHPVASTSSSKVALCQESPLSDLHSPATPADRLSFTELVEPLMTRKKAPLLPPRDRAGPLKERQDLVAKQNKKPLPAPRKGKGIAISSASTNSSSIRGSGSSKASTRSGRTRFESDGESSSRQRKDVPWADIVPSSSALATPKSRKIGTSKSSQSSAIFPMDFTPPDLRVQKQSTLDKIDKLISSGTGSARSSKRKRSSMKEALDFSDECCHSLYVMIFSLTRL
jgi:hypothetical protein